jgi:predicted Zn-dependent protease
MAGRFFVTMGMMLPFAALVLAWAEQLPSHEQANELMQQERFAEAATVFAELSRRQPQDLKASLGLGMALHMAGEDEKAIAPLEAVLKKNPAIPPALLALGSSYLRRGNARRAIVPLERFARLMPQDQQARRMLADAYVLTDSPAKAVPHLEALSRAAEVEPSIWYQLGRAHEAAAREDFNKLSSLAPESGPLFALLAESRSRSRQARAALYFYRKALEKSPDLRGLRLAMAEIYRLEGHPEWALREEAEEARRPALRCTIPTAECEFNAGSPRKALEMARREGGALGLYWSIRAQNALARQAFAQLANLGESVEWLRFQAETHRDEGRIDESVAAWQAARRLQPESPALKRELAAALLEAKNYSEAEKLVKSLLRSDGDAADVNQLAGNLYLAQQMAEEAIPYLMKAGASLPARASLARALILAGRAADAIPHAEAALALDPDGSLHFQLARAYQAAGKNEAAAKAMAAYQSIQAKMKAQQAALEEELTIAPPR